MRWNKPTASCADTEGSVANANSHVSFFAYQQRRMQMQVACESYTKEAMRKKSIHTPFSVIISVAKQASSAIFTARIISGPGFGTEIGTVRKTEVLIGVKQDSLEISDKG